MKLAAQRGGNVSPSREVPSGVRAGVLGPPWSLVQTFRSPLLLSLVSTVQQNESAISIYTYPSFLNFLPIQFTAEH